MLHGLGGHAFYTWCNLKQDHLTDICHWPRDLLPQELQRHRVRARVSTIGYNANVMRRADQTATLENLADSLLSELKLQKLDVSEAPRKAMRCSVNTDRAIDKKTILFHLP